MSENQTNETHPWPWPEKISIDRRGHWADGEAQNPKRKSYVCADVHAAVVADRDAAREEVARLREKAAVEEILESIQPQEKQP